MADSNPLHPDLVTGALADLLQWVARPVANTLVDLPAYAGVPLAELFPAAEKVPRVKVSRRWRVPGLVSEDLVFRSPYQPLEPNFRRRYRRDYRETHDVYARRVRPRNWRQRPRLLYIHGYMQPETYIEEFVLLSTMAVQLDVEVIQLQPPYHGRRTPSGSRFSGEYFWTADLVRSIEALRQTLVDARALLSYLLAQDDRPVGIAGLSLGGALALTLTCLDQRFAFSIPVIAHMDLEALCADAPVLGTMRRQLRDLGWERPQFGELFGGLGWQDLQPKLAPEQILLLAASEDRFFDPKLVEQMWQRWGQPEIRWFPCSHMGFFAHLPEALQVMREFIDAKVVGAARPS